MHLYQDSLLPLDCIRYPKSSTTSRYPYLLPTLTDELALFLSAVYSFLKHPQDKERPEYKSLYSLYLLVCFSQLHSHKAIFGGFFALLLGFFTPT